MIWHDMLYDRMHKKWAWHIVSYNRLAFYMLVMKEYSVNEHGIRYNVQWKGTFY